MYTIKIKGPSHEPWGMPPVIQVQSERELPSLTLCCLSLRNENSHRTTGFRLMFSILCRPVIALTSCLLSCHTKPHLMCFLAITDWLSLCNRLRRTKPVITLPTTCSRVDGYIVVLSNEEQLNCEGIHIY